MAFAWVTIPETTARARLKRAVQSTEDPLLTEVDYDDLMFIARKADCFGVWPDRYTFWQPITAYATLAPIVPTLRNGNFYKASVGGVSGATEPVWPLTTNGTVVDGAVTWQQVGTTIWMESWDLNLAAAEGWRRKAGKCADAYNFSAEGMSLDRNQIFEHCITMMKQYSGRSIGAIGFGQGVPRYDLIQKWLGAPPTPHILYDEVRPSRMIIPGVETNWDP